ncbi:MAG: hypothetical protein AAB605_03950 [Patescibacteria group bacterium]
MTELAEQAALQSALISGFDPRTNGSEAYDVHRKLMADILGCTTGALTHPLIINMDLCGHRMQPEYRRGIRAAEAEYLPDAKYVRHLLNLWWILVEWQVFKIRNAILEEREKFCWEQHDFLICLEPFADANGRTARIVYYMLATALKVPIHIISAEKAKMYNQHKRRYREENFAPRMRKHGYITS